MAHVETCPNCGAPLALDPRGTCPYCGVHVTTRTGAYDDYPNPVRRIMHCMLVLLAEPAARRAAEGFAAHVPALNDAVVAAGRRVLDAGLVVDAGRVDLKVYEPAELWAFDLATDVVAVLAAAPNLAKAKRTAVHGELRILDAGLGAHGSRSMIGNAKPGPALAPLRAAVVHRQRIRD
jgi:hypothetical protein